jgi:hypothetical protein
MPSASERANAKIKKSLSVKLAAEIKGHNACADEINRYEAILVDKRAEFTERKGRSTVLVEALEEYGGPDLDVFREAGIPIEDAPEEPAAEEAPESDSTAE